MSEKTNKETETTMDPEELVTYTAPIDPTGQKQDLLVGVNGEFIRIKRGEAVQIKRKFLEAIENANRQQYAAVMAQQKAEAEGNKALADL